MAFTRIHVAGEDCSVRAHRVHGKFDRRQGRPLGMSLKEGAACAACKNGLIPLSPLAQAAVPEMAIVDRSARECPGNLATGTVGTERVVRATTLELPGAGCTTRRGPRRRCCPRPRAQALRLTEIRGEPLLAALGGVRVVRQHAIAPQLSPCTLCVLTDGTRAAGRRWRDLGCSPRAGEQGRLRASPSPPPTSPPSRSPGNGYGEPGALGSLPLARRPSGRQAQRMVSQPRRSSPGRLSLWTRRQRARSLLRRTGAAHGPAGKKACGRLPCDGLPWTRHNLSREDISLPQAR